MMKPYAIGIDVGGTKIAAGLVNQATADFYGNFRVFKTIEYFDVEDIRNDSVDSGRDRKAESGGFHGLSVT